MKAKDTSSEKFKKFIYYVDEAIVFMVTVLSVMFSELLQTALTTGTVDFKNIETSLGKLLVSCFITIMIYGSMNSSFKYNDKDKPSMFKRIYVSCLQGIGWKTIIGFTKL